MSSRDVPLGHIAYDAAHKKVFHLSREDHDVPEQVQHNCIGDDMIVSLTGQTACDAAHKLRQEHGNGGDPGHGGKAGKDVFRKGKCESAFERRGRGLGNVDVGIF